MEKNNSDVEIRITEAGFCFRDDIFYTCQFRKPGKWLWTTFKKFRSGEVKDIISRDPASFFRYKDYSLEQCIKENEEAYKQLREYNELRDKNYIIKLK